VGAVLLCLFLPSPVPVAEPDWSQIEKRALEFLQQYIRIRSESGPTGQTNLVVRLKGRDASKKPLLLLNHLDVVDVDGKAWKLDPFGGVVRDGYIWGRGALDMKGLGVRQLMALIALHSAGVTPSRDIVILSTADEERHGNPAASNG
jgi:acetylornithine deacetylase/succinyl-diaminopimelate desuccinylase-like protein